MVLFSQWLYWLWLKSANFSIVDYVVMNLGCGSIFLKFERMIHRGVAWNR